MSNANIDTQGKSYTRALQHLTVGCYILMICLIGLFAIATGSSRIALGPLILMIIFLVFVVLFHVSMNSAIDPLIEYLPKNLEAEEEALLAVDYKNQSNSGDGLAGPDVSTEQNRVSNVDSGVGNIDSEEKGLTQAVSPSAHSHPNFFQKWLRPDRYESYVALRRLVPSPLDVPPYTADAERDAYCHPAVTAQAPLLWIPRDPLGVSRQEVAHSSRVIPITDEDAFLDEKCKITWNVEKGEPPIYEEKIPY